MLSVKEIQPTLRRSSPSHWLLAIAFLQGCSQGAGLAEEGTVNEDRPFAYVERNYPDMKVAASSSQRPSLDPRDPFRFNRGAHLFVRDRVSLDSESEDVLREYFGGDLYDVKDLDVSNDGRRIVFAAHGPDGNPTHGSWNIYEYDFDRKQVRRVIEDDTIANLGQDTSPAYTNDDTIVFSSDRQVGKGDFRVADNRDYIEDFNEPASLLHTMTLQGENIKQVTFGNYHDIEPVAMNDGQIVFIRWGREYETLYNCLEQDIDDPNFNTHPHGGGYGHGNGNGFPPGLDEPKEWTDVDKCGGSVAGDSFETRVFISDVFNLFRMSPGGGNLHRYFGDPESTFSDRSFIHFIDPMPAPDGNVFSIMRHIHNPVYGGDAVQINTSSFYAVGKPIDEGVTGEAEESITPGLVNFYPAQVSPAGWYSAIALYEDDTQRMLASWAQCTVFDGERHGPCEGYSVSEDLASSQYGIWSVDPREGTRLPVVKGRAGALYTDIVIGNRNDEAEPYAGTLLGILLDEGFGAFHINSIYDLDGEDQATPLGGIKTLRNPVLIRPDDRQERFIRVLRQVEVPKELIRSILDDPELNPDDGSAPFMGLRPILGSGSMPLYEILSYGMVEPDGSAIVPAPGDVDFTFEVVNKYGKRVNLIAQPDYPFSYLVQHPEPMLLEEGEIRECHGCHLDGADNPHGRFDIERPSANPGAPGSGLSFPDANPAILAERAGDSMARALTQMRGFVSSNRGNLAYEDNWTNPVVQQPEPSFVMDYRELTTPAPFNDPACLDNWTKDCRIVINYLEHIQPLWEVCRPQMDNKSCTSCHDKADNVNSDKCTGGGGPGGDLVLSGDPDPWNPLEVASYVQLFEPDYYQQNINGEWIAVTDPDLDCPVGVQGDLTILPDPEVCFTRRIMSARGAIASARFFKLFDNDTDDDAYEIEVTGATGGNNSRDLSFHKGTLTLAELRLIAEWLDIGGHYYNDVEKYELTAKM